MTAQSTPLWNHPSPPGPQAGGNASVSQTLTTPTSAQRGLIAGRESARLGFESQLCPHRLDEFEHVT